MGRSGGRWLEEASDLATQAAVLQHALEVHPVILTKAELLRELGGREDAFAERDAIDRAVRDLGGAGLLHTHSDFAIPTRAALLFSELRTM